MGTSSNPYANILGIATAIVSTMSWQDTLTTIAEKIGQTLFGFSASINSYDADRRIITYEAYWCTEKASQEDLDYIGHVSFLDDRPDFKMLIEGRQLVESHVDDPAISEAERSVMKEWGLKTTLDAPLIFDGKVIGTVGVAETRFVRRFTSSELDLFAQLCELASIGVQNALTARGRTEVDRRLQALAMLSETLPKASTAEAVHGEIVTAAAAAFGSPAVAISQVQPRLDAPVVQRIHDTDLAPDARAEMERDGVAVRLLVPVASHAVDRGTLVVGWEDERRRVFNEEKTVAAIIASQAALALELTER